MSKPIELTNANFSSEVLTSKIPVLVDFWAPWCGPCRMMAPVLEELAWELDGKVKIAKLNVDDPDHQELAMRYGIQGIPDMKIFRGGAVIGDIVGARPKEFLRREIENSLK